jgi:hypothetical protein
LDAHTKQGAATVYLTYPVSAQTTTFAGVRYQQLRSDLTPEYEEAAIFAGFSHRFH